MQYKDMQVGDKVEITDKRTVTISKIDHNQNAYDERGRLIYALVEGSREFSLIERPIPDLPTKLGSIISVRPDPFDDAREYVLITSTFAKSVWRGVNVPGVYSDVDMAKNVKVAGGFEVIR
jgi:hypothetical protein